jgi:phage gp36-like protein
MSRFLKDSDYDVLIRTEIKSILLENYSQQKLLTAEQMAISQIKNYLAGRYQVNLIFAPLPEEPTEDTRNHFIIMTTIDCALYHLYCSLAPNKIPEHRSQRYQDALEWLKLMAKGATTADLPLIVNEATGEVEDSIRIKSKYKPSQNKW